MLTIHRISRIEIDVPNKPPNPYRKCPKVIAAIEKQSSERKKEEKKLRNRNFRAPPFSKRSSGLFQLENGLLEIHGIALVDIVERVRLPGRDVVGVAVLGGDQGDGEEGEECGEGPHFFGRRELGVGCGRLVGSLCVRGI